MSRTTTGALIAASFSLASCATQQTAGENPVSAAMARLLPGQGPKVVKVRKEDLQEMPTGQELAQAYAQHKSGFWFFGGPSDFVEPSLPEPGAELDGSLLPPRMP